MGDKKFWKYNGIKNKDGKIRYIDYDLGTLSSKEWIYVRRETSTLIIKRRNFDAFLLLIMSLYYHKMRIFSRVVIFDK